MTDTPPADSVPREHKATAPRSIGCFVLTMSDTKTPETDTSGILIRDLLIAAGHTVVGHDVVRDEPAQVTAIIREGCANAAVQAFILTGGTGVTSRDSTFEAVEALLDKRLAGFGELFRMLSYEEIGAAVSRGPR
jgi:molybdenum cofactor biosynthesis protein B